MLPLLSIQPEPHRSHPLRFQSGFGAKLFAGVQRPPLHATALIAITQARGSTPRDTGTCMLVTATCTQGTIGGGEAERLAVEAARNMLADGGDETVLSLPLGPEIGQCCGGHLALEITRASRAMLEEIAAREAASAAQAPLVMIYGAGHVGRALAQALALLPLRVKLVDSRAAEFAGLVAPGVEQVCTDSVVAQAEAAPPGAAHVILTHSHALDSLVAAALLERADFAYLGIIGSKTKRAVFERAFMELGMAPAQIARIICPIGGTHVRDKRPAVIAALVAAELLGVF